MQFKTYLSKKTTAELFEAFEQDEILMEGVVDFIGKYVAQIKNKEDLSDVDISQLAVMMTALQILGDKDLRDSITKDDVGIDANDTKQVYNLLQNVKATGTQESGVKKIINGIVNLAKSKLKSNVEVLTKMKDGDDTEKRNAINAVTKMYGNLQASIQKMKSSVSGSNDMAGKLPQLESLAKPSGKDELGAHFDFHMKNFQAEKSKESKTASKENEFRELLKEAIKIMHANSTARNLNKDWLQRARKAVK